jgi:flagellar basal body rod protein FlgC
MESLEFVLKLGTDHHSSGHTMTFITSSSLAGMNAAQTQLNVAAQHVANLNAPRLKPQEMNLAVGTQGGLADTLEADMVAQLQAKNAFLANLAVFKTQDKMAGALLNTKV